MSERFIVVCILDPEDLELQDSWCITCIHNKGPTLPGGTRNEGQGCQCSNLERVQEISKSDKRTYSAEDLPANLYRVESICDPAMCEGWALGVETPTLYGLKKVEKEETPNCPYCKKEMKPWEGSSSAGINGFVTVNCAFCHETYYYYDPELREMEKIKTVIELTWEIGTLPKDEAAKQKIRAAINEKIMSDLNEYYQNDEEVSMVKIEIKEYGI